MVLGIQSLAHGRTRLPRRSFRHALAFQFVTKHVMSPLARGVPPGTLGRRILCHKDGPTIRGSNLPDACFMTAYGGNAM